MLLRDESAMNDCQLLLFAEIIKGRSRFLVDSPDEVELERFQFIVRALEEMEKEGFIKITRRYVLEQRL